MAKDRTALGQNGSVALTIECQGPYSCRPKRPEPKDGKRRSGPKQGVWGKCDRRHDNKNRCECGTPHRWKATTNRRDEDGKLRQVVRYDATKAKAETKLKAALANRTVPNQGRAGYTPTMLVGDAVAKWFAAAEASGRLAPRTITKYRDTIRLHIVGSTIENLTLREANRVSVLNDWQQYIADHAGVGAATTGRTDIRNAFKAAMKDGALDYSAAASMDAATTTHKKTTRRDTTRAFTEAQRDELIAFADAYPSAVKLDVADLIAFLAGTGVTSIWQTVAYSFQAPKQAVQRGCLTRYPIGLSNDSNGALKHENKLATFRITRRPQKGSGITA